MRKYFEFQNAAKINCGESALQTIGKELTYLKAEKPLLLASSNAAKLGVLEKVTDALKKGGVKEVVLANVVPEAVDLDYVRAQKDAYLSAECDCIVAVGGDETMDSAKVLKLLLTKGWDEILPIASEDGVKGKDVPLIAIPSENGSGKEANGFVEVGEYYFSSSDLIPNVVIIDEDVTMAAPTREVAASGIYALANATEGYLESEETDITSIYAEKAIRLLVANLVSAVKNGDDAEACRATALAATLAGVAYGSAPYGAAHALASGLSETTGLPLEEMFALSLVPAIRRAKERCENRVKNLYFLLVGADEFAETPDSERADRAIGAVETLLTSLGEVSGIPMKISQTGMDRELFGKIAESATDKRASITEKGPIGKEEFLDMLNQAY